MTDKLYQKQNKLKWKMDQNPIWQSVSRKQKKIVYVIEWICNKRPNFEKEQDMQKPKLSKLFLIPIILAMTAALFTPTVRLSAGAQNEMKDQVRLQEILRSTGE